MISPRRVRSSVDSVCQQSALATPVQMQRRFGLSTERGGFSCLVAETYFRYSSCRMRNFLFNGRDKYTNPCSPGRICSFQVMRHCLGLPEALVQLPTTHETGIMMGPRQAVSHSSPSPFMLPVVMEQQSCMKIDLSASTGSSDSGYQLHIGGTVLYED